MKIAQNNVEAVEQYLKENLSSFYSEREIVLFTDILLQDLLAISKSQRLMNSDIRLSESQLLQIIYAAKDLKKYKPILETGIFSIWVYVGHKLFFYFNSNNPKFQNFYFSIEWVCSFFSVCSLLIIFAAIITSD